MKVSISVGGKRYPTRKEKVKECLAALQHDKAVEKPTVITLRGAFVRYIIQNVNKLSEETLRKYSHLADKHFEKIMDIDVFDITQEDLQASFDDEAKKGWTKKTLQNYKSCMKNVLKEFRPDFHPEIVIHAQK